MGLSLGVSRNENVPIRHGAAPLPCPITAADALGPAELTTGATRSFVIANDLSPEELRLLYVGQVLQAICARGSCCTREAITQDDRFGAASGRWG